MFWFKIIIQYVVWIYPTESKVVRKAGIYQGIRVELIWTLIQIWFSLDGQIRIVIFQEVPRSEPNPDQLNHDQAGN